jgi:hypothetical protein
MDTMAEIFIEPLPGRKPGDQKKRGKGLPWHVVRQINEADYDIIEQRLLNVETGQHETVKIARARGVHFICPICKRAYRDTFMKVYQTESLGPDRIACAACYAQEGLDCRPTARQSLTAPAFKRTAPNRTLEEMEPIVIEYLESVRPGQVQEYLQGFLAEFRESHHGTPMMDLLFDKDGRFMANRLEEEWDMYVEFS